MCHPVYDHNGFVATDALGHIKHGHTLLAPMNQRWPLDIYIYIYIYIYMYVIHQRNAILPRCYSDKNFCKV